MSDDKMEIVEAQNIFTSLSLLSGGNDANLSETEAFLMGQEDDDHEAELLLQRIKLAAGGLKKFILGKNEVLDEYPLRGIVLLSRTVRGYWPDKDGEDVPFCSSGDGRIGYVSESPLAETRKAAETARHLHLELTNNRHPDGRYDCARCPLNQWGSAHQGGAGKGKGCKEMRRLLFLPDGWTMPALFALPPTSVTTWDAYYTGLRTRRQRFWSCRTEFSLEDAKSDGGHAYCTVKPTKVDSGLTMAELEMAVQVRDHFRNLFVGLDIDDDYAMNGNGPPDEQAAIDAEVVNGDQENIPF